MNSPSETHDSPPVVAIIGAGQLGYLLCEAAKSLGIPTLIVASDPAEPAVSIADNYIVTDYAASDLAQQIAASADVVTFEFEAVPDELLEALQAEDILIRPSVAVMRLIKNKARQKQWLVDNDIPTADYIEITVEQAEGRVFLDQISPPFVQKAQEGGYDGYGVQIVQDAAGLEGLWPVPSIIEVFLEGARELAVVAVRAVNGEIQIYPPVEMAVDETRNILDLVIAPAQLEAPLTADAEALAHKVVSQLDSQGVFAVEMFLVDGEILVNEVSPRVHNSGHHTIESCSVSQFEQHMRAVAGLPLADVELKTPAVMKNILYADHLAPLVGEEPGLLPVEQESVRIHWYGKKEGRIGRKMGHGTCTGTEPGQGSKLIDESILGLVQK